MHLGHEKDGFIVCHPWSTATVPVNFDAPVGLEHGRRSATLGRQTSGTAKSIFWKKLRSKLFTNARTVPVSEFRHNIYESVFRA